MKIDSLKKTKVLKFQYLGLDLLEVYEYILTLAIFSTYLLSLISETHKTYLIGLKFCPQLRVQPSLWLTVLPSEVLGYPLMDQCYHKGTYFIAHSTINQLV